MAKEYMPIGKSDEDEEFLSDTLESYQNASKFNPLRNRNFLFQILLLLTGFSLIANIYFLVRSSHRVNLQDGLNLGLVPSMPLEIIIFEEKKIYSSRPSPDSDKAWDELLPPGRGYVFIKDGQSHGLKEPGEMTKNGEIYSVALFHQIHCLGMLRGNYWELLSRADKQDDLESLKNFAQHHMKNNHANHCFDYLRQSLQCAADMSLEWPEPGTKSTNGWGVPHLCKSWDSVMGYMDKNHFNASSRHDIGGE